MIKTLGWSRISRYKLIEIIAQWEGRLTTNHLCNTFGISRSQASKEINRYLKEFAPNSLIYDNVLKGYKPTKQFKPKLTTGTADEYLHVLSRSEDITHTLSDLGLRFTNTEILHAPLRQIDPLILRPLIQAARENKRVELNYVSLSNPKEVDRIIAPHTLVCTPLRWHVRAYCEKHRDYRDFVLSRFRGIPEIEGDSVNSKEQDTKWNTKVQIILVADNRLSKDKQKIIQHDYGMKKGKLLLDTRASLVSYALQLFNIDPYKIDRKPEAQQIIVENMESIQPYLFNS